MAQGTGCVHGGRRGAARRDRRDDPPGNVDARRQGREDRRVHGADGDRRVHRRRRSRCSATGRGQVDEACRQAHGVAFMQATPAQRLAVVEALDREQKAAMDARIPDADQARAGRRRAGRRARALFPDDEGAGAARLLHVRDRLHEGDALPRVAGTIRSVRAARARRQVLGRARLIHHPTGMPSRRPRGARRCRASSPPSGDRSRARPAP